VLSSLGLLIAILAGVISGCANWSKSNLAPLLLYISHITCLQFYTMLHHYWATWILCWLLIQTSNNKTWRNVRTIYGYHGNYCTHNSSFSTKRHGFYANNRNIRFTAQMIFQCSLRYAQAGCLCARIISQVSNNWFRQISLRSWDGNQSLP
jgi:hypothetical protein